MGADAICLCANCNTKRTAEVNWIWKVVYDHQGRTCGFKTLRSLTISNSIPYTTKYILLHRLSIASPRHQDREPNQITAWARPGLESWPRRRRHHDTHACPAQAYFRGCFGTGIPISTQTLTEMVASMTYNNARKSTFSDIRPGKQVQWQHSVGKQARGDGPR